MLLYNKNDFEQAVDFEQFLLNETSNRLYDMFLYEKKTMKSKIKIIRNLF